LLHLLGLLGGRVIKGTPKTKAGERLIFLDAQTARMLRERRTAQVKARMLAGEAWRDNNLIFAPGGRQPVASRLCVPPV